MMQGMMMHRPLLISDILEFAASAYSEQEIISRRVEGDIHRATYAQTRGRVSQLSHALVELGVGPSDRVATLAWNGYRHFELYYGVSGMGAVCHTINPRLPAEQVEYIISHAEDTILFLEFTFVDMIEKLKDRLPSSLRYVVMTDEAHMPSSTTLSPLCYETLLEGHPTTFDWPELDENTAASLCYTSGTTGNPKGALYSHRSTVLHAMSAALSFMNALGEGRKILPAVPLFHVNAWGLPYTCPLVGASLVMPGPGLDGDSLFELMDAESVYSMWGVPTVFQGLLATIQEKGRAPDGFCDAVIGGSAVTQSLIDAYRENGVEICHAWGMTELSPLGTQGNLPAGMASSPKAERDAFKLTQGRRLFSVQMKLVNDNGAAVAHDGVSPGELYVRGNSTISQYYRNDEATASAIDADGWFGTGDVATLDARGCLTITDRAKDLIKSGGEWISSLDIENIAMSHPDVRQCAVIAVPHEKWGERPLLIVVPEAESTADLAGILALIGKHVSSWQVPDDIVLTDRLPLAPTGKISKKDLREIYADYVLPQK